MAVDPLIELQGVNKYHGEPHVPRDGDLTVGRGEAVVVVGPSGSGKSTPCRTVNRLETVRSGTVRHGVEPLSREGRTLARSEVRRRGKGDADRRSRALLGRVGLLAHADAYPAQPSSGRQRRVAIARAPAMESQAMLFDEPTSALDPEMINEVPQVVRQLARDGMTTVVGTHETGYARACARRVVCTADGRIVEDRAPQEFSAIPRSERAGDVPSEIPKH